MRNLSTGNKTNFAMFIIIVAIIMVIIMCAVVIGLKNQTEKYQITSDTFAYDNNYKFIELENDAQIIKKWTGDYYLQEQQTNKEYNLGKYSVVYNLMRKSLDLFGTFYQVEKGGEIIKVTDHNTINNTFDNKFYKIDDRKYLIISKNIKNDTGSLSTENYLIIIMDKLGNALLLNDKINAKTINEMTISTDGFDFDVANEVLKFKDEEINLKKIIGSTNEYVQPEPEKEEKKEDEQKNTNVQQSTIISQNSETNNYTNVSNNNVNVNNNNNNGNSNSNGSGNSNSNGNENKRNTQKQDYSWVESLNNWINDVATGFESIHNNTGKKKEDTTALSKSISLNGITPGTTSLEIHYNVEDPENMYNIVYAIVASDTETYSIALDKNSTTYKVTNLKPNTSYSVSIGYKIIYSEKDVEEVKQDSMIARTTSLNESLEITKVSLDKIYYTLKLDSDLAYDEGCKLVVYLNDDNKYMTINLTDSMLTTAALSGYTSSFEIPTSYKASGSTIKIQLEDTKIDGNEIETNLIAKIVNY